MIDEKILYDQLDNTLRGTDFKFLNAEKYEGKVRDNYTRDDHRLLVTTDKLSAFDRIITTIPFKGEILNRLTVFWFEKMSDTIKSHYIESPDPNCIYARECQPLKVEMVVRGYITGSTATSLWYNYEKGERKIYGINFPDGLVKNQKLPAPIITPTTKADKGEHDEKLTKDEILSKGLLTPEEWDYLSCKSIELFKAGSKHCARNGVILVDTKYEFGKTKDGEIVLIDEIHTPDSSRFWISETYEKKLNAGEEPDNINKEYLRLWLADRGYIGEGPPPDIPDEVRVETAKKYIQSAELITGQSFDLESVDTLRRIEKNIKNFFNI